MRRLTGIAAAAALLAGPGVARADGASFPGGNELSDELGVASSPPTPGSQRATQVANSLDALLDLGRGLNLDLGVDAVRLTPTGAAPGAPPTRGATIWTFTAGLIGEFGEHLTLDASVHASPAADLTTDFTADYRYLAGGTVRTDQVEAALVSRSSSAGALLAATWDTAGDSDAETAVDLGVGLEHFSSEQRLEAPRDRQTGATVTLDELVNSCRLFPGRCPRALVGALLLSRRAAPVLLNQVALRAGAVETLWRDTDLGLSGSWYLYDRDPTEAGYFGLAAAGRTGTGGAIPIAPLLWSVRPSATRRLGAWTLRLELQHGVYASSEGRLDALAAKVQLRFTRAFRMWVTAGGQRDVDFAGTVTTVRSASLGALLQW